MHECAFRIKIYKKEGLSWANFTLPYYVGYQHLNDERVTFDNAVTYNLENGQIVKTKLAGEGKFKQAVNEYWAEASLAMPAVKAGSVIEYRYTLTSERISEFPVFRFQYDIPVHYAEYQSEVPEFYIYKPVITGFGNVLSDAKVVGGYQNFTNQYNQTVNLSFQQINSIHKIENVPALRSEPFLDNLSNYRLSIFHELERTRYPDAPEKNYAMTWDGVAKTIYKERDFGKELALRGYFDADLATIVKGIENQEERLDKIFTYVKTAMSWNGQYGYYVKKGVKTAYQERSGNTADINFILIAMLNHAGIVAEPVLLSTVDHGIPVFPNYSVFNYVIAAADLNGKRVLLDATSKTALPGFLPERDLNWNGRLIRKDGSTEEIPLLPQTASMQTATVLATLDAAGKLTGKIRRQFSEYEGLHARALLATKGTDAYLQDLEQATGIEVGDFNADNLQSPDKPLSETFNFAWQPEQIGQRLYLDPLLFLVRADHPLHQESRKMPLYFGYPLKQKFNITLDIPDGYVVESLPKSASITTGEGVAQFSFQVQQTGNKIQLVFTNERSVALVSSSFFEPLKSYFQKLSEKQKEKIILKKT